MTRFLRYFFAAFCLLSSFCFAEFVEPAIVYLTWQRSPDTTMTIQWITGPDQRSDWIEYKTLNGNEWQKMRGAHALLPEGAPYFLHRLELTGLQPATGYLFRFGPESNSYKFRTMPSTLKDPIRFVEGGDVYHDDIEHVEAMNRRAAAENPSFALVGGDLAYTSSTFSFLFQFGFGKEKIQRWITWLTAWTNTMQTPEGYLIPLLPAIGNHEVMGRFEKTPAFAPFFYALFPMPGYKVLDFGNYLSVFFLDSYHTHPIEGAQTQWLSSALEKRSAMPHKIALYHVPAYPSVRNFENVYSQLIRRYWIPIFDKFGLHIAFEHHDHALKRTYPLRNGAVDPTGTIYLGDGAWGIEKPRIPTNRWYLAKKASVQHVWIVTLNENTRHFKAIDVMGNIVDEQ